MQQLRDVRGAWRRLRRHVGVGSIIGFSITLVILLGALNLAIQQLSGQNVAVDTFRWLTHHLGFLLTLLTTPIWLIVALSLAVLVLATAVTILGKRYSMSRRSYLQAVEEMRQSKALAAQETQKKNLLGKTLERLELATFSIVKAMDKVAAGELQIAQVLLDSSLSDQEKARRLADIHQPLERVFSHVLGSVIIHAQDLFGEPGQSEQERAASDTKVSRGGILVPVSQDTPYLIHCADSGWGPEEKELQFYIRSHPRNFLDKRSVAGAAYADKSPQECHWLDDEQRFNHSDYNHSNIFPPGSEPYKSFIAYPLQADLLLLSQEEDKTVLGVLCLDSPQAGTFKGSPLLNQASPQDLPVIRIMRVMYYLLQLRQTARPGPS
ncbi:MAG TPA: hypothetical protein VKQ30_24195 [Ktedonobacterales bacterium]|nr:hypothetical protein [Ktedonobacterales bacterium]